MIIGFIIGEAIGIAATIICCAGLSRREQKKEKSR